jgi:Zn-dependent peptidase ImmA (M78 family)
MMQHPNPETLAHAFWAGTGLQDTFPRDIERAIAMKLPLTLVKLPQLNTKTIGQWLERRCILTPLPLDPRDLFGSLVAYRGYGIIFVCGADDQAEQRLTVAHEVAHFLVDYLLPRQQVIRALGEHMTEILDGLRKATPAERASAILSHLHLGAHTHLLPRPGQDEDEGGVAAVEDRAERLARELVAPQERVHALLQDLSTRATVGSEDACSALAAYFGLPPYTFDDIFQTINQRHPVSFLADMREVLRRW